MASNRLGVPQRVRGGSMNKVSYQIDDLPPLTAKQQADLEYLATLSDDNIDLSDITEVTDWSNAIRGSIKPQAFRSLPRQASSTQVSLPSLRIEPSKQVVTINK